MKIVTNIIKLVLHIIECTVFKSEVSFFIQDVHQRIKTT